MDQHVRAKLARGSYWCPRARRFLQPGDIGYDRAMFEQLTLGPLERGEWGDDAHPSGVYTISG
jgi:hypothetical protein